MDQVIAGWIHRIFNIIDGILKRLGFKNNLGLKYILFIVMENLQMGNQNIIDLIVRELESQLTVGTDNNEEHISQPASEEFINSLELMEIQEEGVTCSICLEEFELREKCLKLPCKGHPHFFHDEKENCMGVKKWLEKSNTCPVCRTEFPKEDAPTENGVEIDRERMINGGVIHLMNNIIRTHMRILNPQEVVEMEEQRQLEAAIQASLEEQ